MISTIRRARAAIGAQRGCSVERRAHDRPAARPNAVRAEHVAPDAARRRIALAPQRSSRRAISGASIGRRRDDQHRLAGEIGRRDSVPSALSARRQRHGDTEASSPRPARFRPSMRAAHALDDAPRDRKPEAGAAEFARRCRRRPARTRGRCAPAAPARCRCRCRAPGSDLVAVQRPASTISATPPFSVNLIALPARLSSTWRSRVASPITRAGSRSSTSEAISRPLACARGPSSSTISSTMTVERERLRLQLEPAGLDLGEIQDLLDQRQQRVARGLRRP